MASDHDIEALDDGLVLLARLHWRKDRAYGDAWRKRGEVLAIFANIARKHDRLMVAFDELVPATTEDLLETAADQFVYFAKYLTWLAETESGAFAAALPSLDPAACAADTGPEAVEEIFSAVRDDAHDSRPLDARRAWDEIQGPFAELERGLVAQAQSSGSEQLTAARKVELAWQLAGLSAWLFVLEGQDRPEQLARFRASIEAMDQGPGPGGDPDFEDQLIEQTVAKAIDIGAEGIVLLGLSATAVRVRSALEGVGLGPAVIGIFDPDVSDEQAHLVRHWAELGETPLDLVVVCVDAGKETLLFSLARVLEGRDHFPQLLVVGTGHLAFSDPRFFKLDAPAMVPSYATGSPRTRIHLFECLAAAAANALSGAVVEFGAFKGGTTAWLARVVDHFNLDAKVIAFDSWDGFPPRRSVLDAYEHPRCVFRDLDAVRAYVEPLGVELVAGDISDTASERLANEPILLAFLDTDNYSPARAALEVVTKNLVVGGAIVFDHYWTTDEYVATIGERMAGVESLGDGVLHHLDGTGVFVRIG